MRKCWNIQMFNAASRISLPKVDCYYWNTRHNYIRGATWEKLKSRNSIKFKGSRLDHDGDATRRLVWVAGYMKHVVTDESMWQNLGVGMVVTQSHWYNVALWLVSGRISQMQYMWWDPTRTHDRDQWKYTTRTLSCQKIYIYGVWPFGWAFGNK